MKTRKANLALFAFLLISLFSDKIMACSMYKITVDGKTVVGCNHDSWFSTPKIWFENGKNQYEFGAAFTGARQTGGSRTAPQSGMNEKGLAFSRLEAYYPRQKLQFLDKLKIDDEVDYLSDILHKCTTIQDVRKYIEAYDHSVFYDDVFIYIDSSGRYLIVEPYALTEGNDLNYVLSNFCPSITDNGKARKLTRYRNGEDFIRMHKVDASPAYFSALSDTMHVCRSRNGDGTLLTSIWDTKNGVVNLCFYHNFDSTYQFELSEELIKGDHSIDIPGLFPVNSEFERLKSYKTPFNTPILRFLLLAIAAILFFTIPLLILTEIKLKSTEITIKNTVLISALNLLLIGYLFVLATNVSIYYFDAPYMHYSSHLFSISSYIPFLLLIVIIPVSLFTRKRLKSADTKAWIKAVLITNNLIYLLLILSFAYWGLYSIWN